MTYDLFFDIKPRSGQGKCKKETKEQMDIVFEDISKKRKIKLITNPVRMRVIFYFKENCNYDLDNLLKGFIDGLQGQLISNDKLIMEIHAKKEPYSLMTGVAVRITELVSYGEVNETSNSMIDIPESWKPMTE